MVPRPSLSALVVSLALAAGCAAPRHRVGDAPPPRVVESAPLSRESALAVARQQRSSERAVQALEARRLSFPLDATNVEWLRDHGAPPEVVLSLKRRANAEWRERTAEDEADRPFVESYAAPVGRGFDARSGDGDFAGSSAAWGSGGVERPVYVEGSPMAGLRHALSPAPGPEPFPDPRLEPPAPPPVTDPGERP